jgi:hypothetical protein
LARLISIDQVRLDKPLDQIGKIVQRVTGAIDFREFRVNEVEPAILTYEFKFSATSHFSCFSHRRVSRSNTSNSVDALGLDELLIHREVQDAGVVAA